MNDKIYHTKTHNLHNRIFREVSSLFNVARTENSCKKAVLFYVNFDTRTDTCIPVKFVLWNLIWLDFTVRICYCKRPVAVYITALNTCRAVFYFIALHNRYINYVTNERTVYLALYVTSNSRLYEPSVADSNKTSDTNGWTSKNRNYMLSIL
jgi:hypothetical protein